MNALKARWTYQGCKWYENGSWQNEKESFKMKPLNADIDCRDCWKTHLIVSLYKYEYMRN